MATSSQSHLSLYLRSIKHSPHLADTVEFPTLFSTILPVLGELDSFKGWDWRVGNLAVEYSPTTRKTEGE